MGSVEVLKEAKMLIDFSRRSPNSNKSWRAYLQVRVRAGATHEVFNKAQLEGKLQLIVPSPSCLSNGQLQQHESGWRQLCPSVEVVKLPFIVYFDPAKCSKSIVNSQSLTTTTLRAAVIHNPNAEVHHDPVHIPLSTPETASATADIRNK